MDCMNRTLTRQVYPHCSRLYPQIKTSSPKKSDSLTQQLTKRVVVHGVNISRQVKASTTPGEVQHPQRPQSRGLSTPAQTFKHGGRRCKTSKTDICRRDRHRHGSLVPAGEGPMVVCHLTDMKLTSLYVAYFRVLLFFGRKKFL